MVTVAFELKYCIHHMFQYFRTGKRAIFSNMPDQDYWDSCGFGKALHFSSCFAYLRNAASR